MLPIADSHKTGKPPLVIWFLIFLNIVVFIVELATVDIESFFTTYAFTPALFDFWTMSSWLPIITAAFLHGGFTHILFNMLFLWVFGDNVEDSLGTIGFILFYLGATISAGLLQYIIDPTSTIPMLGASGAIAGTLGYYLVIFPRHRIKTLMFLGGGIFTQELPAQIFLGYWAITQFFSGVGSLASQGSEGGTAWFAHIGGLLFGVLVGLMLRSRATRHHFGKYEVLA